MNGALALAKREFQSFFNSPVAYVVFGAFLFFSGGLYSLDLFLAGQASVRGLFEWASWFFVALIPAITMRSIAEERKSGTLELLLTLPLSDFEVAIGKFIASFGMVALAVGCTLPIAAVVSTLTAPGSSFDWGGAMAGYLGMLLLGSSLTALGLWGSSLSKSQIVGFIVSCLLCLTLSVVGVVAMFVPESLGAVFEFLSVRYHFENLARGVIDTRDVLYYLSVTAIGLALTTTSLQTIRR